MPPKKATVPGAAI
jgi:hypothetical protein